MRLLDSNIIIYATAPENEWLRTWFEVEPFAVSQISQIEVLGYHQITPEEITDLEEFLECVMSSRIKTYDQSRQSGSNRDLLIKNQLPRSVGQTPLHRPSSVLPADAFANIRLALQPNRIYSNS